MHIRKGPPESTQDGMYVNMETCCSDTCRNWCIDEHVKDSLVKIWSILGHIGACREANRASGANIRVGICFSTGDRARHIAICIELVLLCYKNTIAPRPVFKMAQIIDLPQMEQIGKKSYQVSKQKTSSPKCDRQAGR